jgi:hypothetical protein
MIRFPRLVLGLMLAAAAPAVAGLLQDAAKRLPMTTDAVDVRCPIASVCEDGAAWLCWWQKYPDNWTGHSVGQDIGVFCRLYDRSGHDLVRPTRLVAPRGPGDAMTHQNPEPFFSCSTPEGGLVVFMHQYTPGPRASGPGHEFAKVDDGDGTVRTLVAYAARNGKVGSTVLDFPVDAGWAGIGGVELRTAGYGHMQVVFGGDGVMHCFFGYMHEQGYYARVALKEGRLSVIDTVRLEFSSKAAPDRSPPPYTDRQRLLWWVLDERMKVATRILGRDTLLVVKASDSREYDRSLGNTIPGGTISSYRLKLPGLSLIDSTSATDSTVTGVSSIGRYPRRAALVTTKQGMVFCLPYPQGMYSYALDGAGKPVRGIRSVAPVRPASAFSAKGVQFLEFAKPGDSRPWVMEWFGLDDAGNAYYDVLRTESIPGRTR